MIRVGLVGLGVIGDIHAQCYAALPNVELAAVADTEPDRREQFSQTFGARSFSSLEEMLLADIDMVDICLPTFLHCQATKAVAAAKKPVLCEKPMALTLAECDEMIAAVRAASVNFMIAHVLRFWPEYLAIKEILDSGRMGHPQWASASRSGGRPVWDWKGWLSDPKRSGGAILDLHIHDLDFISWVLGPPDTISAAAITGAQGGYHSVFTTTTGHPNGAVGFAEGSLELAPKFPFTMALKLNLEGGTIEYNSRLTPSLLVSSTSGEPEHPKIPRTEVPAFKGTKVNISELGGYYNEIKYFIDCLEKGQQPTWITPEEAKFAVALCLAATQSAKEGRSVEVTP